MLCSEPELLILGRRDAPPCWGVVNGCPFSGPGWLGPALLASSGQTAHSFFYGARCTPWFENAWEVALNNWAEILYSTWKIFPTCLFVQHLFIKGSDVPEVMPDLTNKKVKGLSSCPWLVCCLFPGQGRQAQVKLRSVSMITGAGAGPAGALRRGS